MINIIKDVRYGYDSLVLRGTIYETGLSYEKYLISTISKRRGLHNLLDFIWIVYVALSYYGNGRVGNFCFIVKHVSLVPCVGPVEDNFFGATISKVRLEQPSSKIK